MTPPDSANHAATPVPFSLSRAAAYLIALASLGLIPVHSFVSCDTSGLIGGLSLLATVFTALLGMLTPVTRRDRLVPLYLSLAGMVLHTLFTH